MDEFGKWITEHPRAARGAAIAIVAFSTWCYIGTLRHFVALDLLLKQRASDAARAASEALGG